MNMKLWTLATVGICLVLGSAVYGEVLFSEDFDNVGTDRQKLVEKGWEFVAAAGAPSSPYTAVTVEFNLQAIPGALNPKRTEWPNPPGERGLPTSGNFLISDADAYDGSWTDPRTGETYDSVGANLAIDSGQSYDAITPPIDCSNASQVYLRADTAVLLNNNGSAVFMIDVKAGDGDWVTKEMRVAPARFPGESFQGVLIRDDDPYRAIPGKDGNMGGLYGRYYLDISDVAAGKSDVRIRFRHYEEDWDWWVAIDNLQISTDPPPMGSEVILGPEEFEDGLPGDWTMTNIAGILDAEWRHSSNHILADWPEDPDYIKYQEAGGEMRHKDGHSLNRLAGQGYAIYMSFEESTDAETALDTPVLDCSNYAEVFFYAWMEYLPNHVGDGPGDTFFGRVQVSTDGGSTFTDIFDFTQAFSDDGEDAYATQYYLPVPEAAGQSQVVFRFYAGGQGDGVESFFAIDDVTITGNVTTSVDSWMIR